MKIKIIITWRFKRELTTNKYTTQIIIDENYLELLLPRFFTEDIEKVEIEEYDQ